MPFPNQREVTTEDREEFLRLHEAGHSAREIARMTGWGHSAVSRHLHLLDADIDRSKTAQATTARVRLINEQRMNTAEAMMDDIASMRHRIWDTYTVIVPSPDGPITFELSEPPLREQADGFKAIQAMTNTVTKLIDMASGDSAAEAKSTLLSIFNGLNSLLSDDEDDEDSGYDIRYDPDEQEIAPVGV